jgi:hypothetical protein
MLIKYATSEREGESYPVHDGCARDERTAVQQKDAEV